jgi:glucan phosphorylase
VVVGKELRLKQQYFWTAASLADMMRRFKNLEKPISEFADCMSFISAKHPIADNCARVDNAIQLNDVGIRYFLRVTPSDDQ